MLDVLTSFVNCESIHDQTHCENRKTFCYYQTLNYSEFIFGYILHIMVKNTSIYHMVKTARENRRLYKHQFMCCKCNSIKDNNNITPMFKPPPLRKLNIKNPKVFQLYQQVLHQQS